MQKRLTLFLVFAAALALPLHADTGLYDWAFNVDGTMYEHFVGNVPPVYTGTFNWTTGLGTLQILIPGAGSHYFAAFFDHEIDAALPDAQFDEYGSTGGVLAAGQSWEIDEPGWASGYTPAGPIWGDIYTRAIPSPAGPPNLENLNSVPITTPYDVSMALAWSFVTPADQDALITLRLATDAPASGFYLAQHESDDPAAATIYFSSTVTFQGGTQPVIPEPGSWALLGTVAAVLGGSFWRKRRGA